MVVTDEAYPEVSLTPEDLGGLHMAFFRTFKSGPPGVKIPRLETSFCKEGVFVLIAADEEAKAWVHENVPRLAPEGRTFRVGGVELLQSYTKATARFPPSSEEPREILAYLEASNPSLKTDSWRLIKTQEETGVAQPGKEKLLVMLIPESQVRALQALDYRPFYTLGRVHFKLPQRVREEKGIEGAGTAS